jgi:hypothetical protein
VKHALLLVALVLEGCGAQPLPEAIPYRFSQSLLLGGHQPPERSAPAAAASRGASPETAARRCLGLVGRVPQGSAQQARQWLLHSCTGRTLPPASMRGEGLDLRPTQPRLLDLAVFRTADGVREVGVVVQVEGERARFVFLRGDRADLGRLNLAHPDRRRLEGSTRIENSYLRVIRPADPPTTTYLAGQLLAGFATLD